MVEKYEKFFFNFTSGPVTNYYEVLIGLGPYQDWSQSVLLPLRLSEVEKTLSINTHNIKIHWYFCKPYIK